MSATCLAHSICLTNRLYVIVDGGDNTIIQVRSDKGLNTHSHRKTEKEECLGSGRCGPQCRRGRGEGRVRTISRFLEGHREGGMMS